MCNCFEITRKNSYRPVSVPMFGSGVLLVDHVVLVVFRSGGRSEDGGILVFSSRDDISFSSRNDVRLDANQCICFRVRRCPRRCTVPVSSTSSYTLPHPLPPHTDVVHVVSYIFREVDCVPSE